MTSDGTLLARWERLRDDRQEALTREWQGDGFAAWSDQWEAEIRKVLTSPITSAADAAAKLECAVEQLSS